MKNTLLLLFVGLLSFSAVSQRDYDDLLDLFVDEKYDRLLLKAEKYTYSDKTKKDPLPYLYMSMTYFEMNKRPETYGEDYPKAFRNSLKFCVKYRKKDKEDLYLAEYEEYFDELRLATISEADAYMDQEKYTKCKGFYAYITKIDDDDAGAWVLFGLSLHRLKSKRDAADAILKAKTIISDMGCNHLTETQMTYLKAGIIMYSEYMDEIGERAEAKEWMELGYEHFKDDKEYNVTYEMIAG